MSKEELWQLFPILLTPPNPDWGEWAEQEISYLHTWLGNLITNIGHIGSTAVEGIWAKPIVDIIIETESVSNFPDIKHTLISAGYICMNQTGERLDFNKGYTPDGYADRVFHLHIRRKGDNDEIFFRDFLRSHPDVAREYERLKLSLWKQYEHDRDGYTDAKSEFVTHYTTLARKLFATVTD